MTVKWKICEKCGKRVNEVADKCPYCNSTSFLTDKIIVRNNNSIAKIKYTLFYWKNDNGMFTFSKTKFISLLIILVCASDFSLNHYSIIAGIFMGLIFAFPVFFVGWIFHKSRESNDFINYDNTDKGLARDIIRTFIYWGDDVTSNFRLSKTKIISLLVFFLFGLINASYGLVVGSITGLIFAVPAFGIGYLIHQHNHEDILDKVPYDKKIEPKKEPSVQKVKSLPEKPKPTFEKIDDSKFAVYKKEEVETPKIHPSLLKYKKQVDNLTKEFESKEINTRQLIEKRFGPPQLTYTKFMASVDKCSELFNNQVDAIMTVLNLATEENEAIDLQIKENINVLQLLIDKLDELSNELVLNIGKSKSKEKDLNNFIDSMDDLIDSVKDY